ncbi:MAG: hypothetical protein H6865_06785 [Rhodospirillales bacterium]|nr:hypothetical protein [Rhodospirillales bacterium]USO07823.1 MAG: hypothetical protein H6866_00915 [Rhodospirillales bacterium]
MPTISGIEQAFVFAVLRTVGPAVPTISGIEQAFVFAVLRTVGPAVRTILCTFYVLKGIFLCAALYM